MLPAGYRFRQSGITRESPYIDRMTGNDTSATWRFFTRGPGLFYTWPFLPLFKYLPILFGSTPPSIPAATTAGNAEKSSEEARDAPLGTGLEAPAPDHEAADSLSRHAGGVSASEQKTTRQGTPQEASPDQTNDTSSKRDGAARAEENAGRVRSLAAVASRRTTPVGTRPGAGSRPLACTGKLSRERSAPRLIRRGVPVLPQAYPKAAHTEQATPHLKRWQVLERHDAHPPPGAGFRSRPSRAAVTQPPRQRGGPRRMATRHLRVQVFGES